MTRTPAQGSLLMGAVGLPPCACTKLVPFLHTLSPEADAPSSYTMHSLTLYRLGSDFHQGRIGDIVRKRQHTTMAYRLSSCQAAWR